MPNKQELEKLVQDCVDKKGWSYDRCKRYVAGGIWGGQNPSVNDVHIDKSLEIQKKKKNNLEEDGMKTYSIQAVPILKAGSWTDMFGNKVEFTIDDLDEIVKNTNALLKAKLLEPPLKFGHNEKQDISDGLPALGYVEQIYRLGNQVFADFANVPEQVYNLLQKKAYSKVSSEVYMDFNHPETGENIGKTLRAVALLGADLPAIKGLGDILSLYKASEYRYSTLMFSENELMSKSNMEDKMVKTWKIKDIKETIKCDACAEIIKKFMEEDKKQEITTEEFAVYLTKMRMMKLEDNNNKKEEITCPDGFEWNEVECISKNKEEIDGHICPKGYNWDEEQNKCVPIENPDEEQQENPQEEQQEEETEGETENMKEKGKQKKEEKGNGKDILDDKEALKELVNKNADKIKNFKFINDERPPKGWWDKCTNSVSDVTDTPEQLCGWIYYDHMNPEKKAEIESTRAKEETSKMSENPEVIALKEKVKKMTMKEFKNKLSELKEKNRDILIPALDEKMDKLFAMLCENERVVKFSDGKEVSSADFFFDFVKSFINAKRVIFSELAKNEDNKINNILNEKDGAIYDGKMKVENVKLAKLAEAISKKDSITYAEALLKANKLINGGK